MNIMNNQIDNKRQAGICRFWRVNKNLKRDCRIIPIPFGANISTKEWPGWGVRGEWRTKGVREWGELKEAEGDNGVRILGASGPSWRCGASNISARAGIAGNYQWGLDGGDHQEGWNPYNDIRVPVRRLRIGSEPTNHLLCLRRGIMIL